MSHIVNNVDEKGRIVSYIELVRDNGYKTDVLYEILNGIIPVNDRFQVCSEVNNEGYLAYFSWINKVIHLNENDLLNYIKNLLNSVIKVYPSLEKYKSELFSYLVLFVLLHEVEHVYQYMFGHGYLDHNYKLVCDLYRNTTKFSVSDKTPKIIENILFSRYKTVKDRATFVLERNANVEAYDLLHKVSLIEGNSEIIRFMYNQFMWYSACGYLKIKNNGSFEESYKDIWRHRLFNSFDFSEDISFEDRVRYGLPLEDDDRLILLKKFVDTKENIK